MTGTPPNSGFGGPTDTGADFFRPDETPDVKSLPQEPDASFTPTRIQFSIRLRFNPIRNLTPELLSQYLDAFRLGFFRNAALAWEAMERRDTRLQTVAPKRKKSVACNGWEVLTLDDSPEAGAQQKFLKDFYNNISTTTALEPDEQGGFALLIRQMMDAVGKRYAVHEIVWQPQADGTLRAKFIACPLWWFEGTRGKLRFLLSEFDIYGVDMDPGAWLVTVGDGLMEACSVAYMFKHLPLRDWLAFSEKFGTPGILGKTEAAINSPEWGAMEETVKNFSADWAAVTNQTNSLELIEVKGNGDQPFKPLVDLMNEEMTRLWRGSDLATSSKVNSTGASLQGDESDILEMDDVQMLTDTLKAQVSRFALAWKFGWETPQLAYVQIKASEKDTSQKDLAIDQFLLTAGAPLSISDTLRRYNRPMPEAGAELLTPPVAPPKPGEDDPDAEIANTLSPRNPQPATRKKLSASAKSSLAAAVQEDLSHVLGRLNEILKISDDEIFLKKLQAFAQDFPALKQSILADPAAARALQPILGAALANGLATAGAELANGDLPGHEFHGNQSPSHPKT